MGQLQQIAATTTVQTGRDHGQATLAPSAVILSAVGDVRLSDAAGEPIPPEQYAQLLKRLVLEPDQEEEDEEEEQPPQCSLKVVLLPNSTATRVQESRAQLALGGYAQPQQVASESLQLPSWAFEFSWTGSPPTAEQLHAPLKRMAKMWLDANPQPLADGQHHQQQQGAMLPGLLVMVPVQPAGSDQQQQPQQIAQAVPIQQQGQGQQPQQLLAGTLENLLAFYKHPSAYEPHVTPAAVVDPADAEPAAAAEGSAAAAEAPTPGGRKLLRGKRGHSPGVPSQTQGGAGGVQLGGGSRSQAAMTGMQRGSCGNGGPRGGCSPQLNSSGELLPPPKRPRMQCDTGCRAAAAALALVAAVQGAPPCQSPGPAGPQQPVAGGDCHVARDAPSSPSLPAIPSHPSSTPSASNPASGAAAAAATAAAAYSLHHQQQQPSPLGQVAEGVVPLVLPAGSSLQRARSPVKAPTDPSDPLTGPHSMPGAPCAPCSTPGAPVSSSERDIQPQLPAGSGPGVTGNAGGVWVAVGAPSAAAGPAPGEQPGQNNSDPLGAGKLCFVVQRPDKQRLRPRMQLFKPCAQDPAVGGLQPDCKPAGGDPAAEEATVAAAAAAPRTVPGWAMPAGADGCLPQQAPGQQQLCAPSRLRCFEVRCMVLALDQQQAEAAVQVSSDVILCQTSVRPISTPPGEPHSSPAAVTLLSSSGSAAGSMPAAAEEQQEVVQLPPAPASPAMSPAKGAAAAAPSLPAHQQDAAGALPSVPPEPAPGQPVAGAVEPQPGQQPPAAAAGAGPIAVPPPAVATPANAAAAVSAPPSGHQNAAAALAVDPGGAQPLPGTPAAAPAAPPSTQQRQGQQPMASADDPPQQQQQQPAPLVPTWPLSGDTGMFTGLSAESPVAVVFNETCDSLDQAVGQLQLRVLSGKGKGGQGAVFEAEVAGYSGSNTALQELSKQSVPSQRPVALKVLLRYSDLTPQAAACWSAGGWYVMGSSSFMTEVEAASWCRKHDVQGHVLRVHAIGRVPVFTGQPGGECKPRPALILEYAAGGTVREQLDAHGGKLDWDPQQASQKAWVVARRMYRALRVASRAQVVHRDCKPDSAFLMREGDLESVKVGDFGYAYLVEEAGARSSTQVFTPGYAAPEVVGHMRYGTELDVWLLGCSLLEMLTGRAPFYHAESLPPAEKAALRSGSELVRAGSPYWDPTHRDYDQVGRHLTETERETLQQLLCPTTAVASFCVRSVPCPTFCTAQLGCNQQGLVYTNGVYPLGAIMSRRLTYVGWRMQVFRV